MLQKYKMLLMAALAFASMGILGVNMFQGNTQLFMFEGRLKSFLGWESWKIPDRISFLLIFQFLIATFKEVK